MADGKVDGNFVKSASLEQRVVQRYLADRRAAAKFAVVDTYAALVKKCHDAEYTGVQKILARVNLIAKTIGYTLDMQQSYLEARTGSGTTIEGRLRFKEIPGARNIVLGESAIHTAMRDLFDLWSYPRMNQDGFDISV
jgi:hypothetical protein